MSCNSISWFLFLFADLLLFKTFLPVFWSLVLHMSSNSSKFQVLCWGIPSIWNRHFIQGEIQIEIHSSSCPWPIFPVPFVEETLFSPVYFFSVRLVAVSMWIYFWVLSILFHQSTSLFGGQYHDVFDIMTWSHGWWFLYHYSFAYDYCIGYPGSFVTPCVYRMVCLWSPEVP